jgi:hypothetical protein
MTPDTSPPRIMLQPSTRVPSLYSVPLNSRLGSFLIGHWVGKIWSKAELKSTIHPGIMPILSGTRGRACSLNSLPTLWPRLRLGAGWRAVERSGSAPRGACPKAPALDRGHLPCNVADYCGNQKVGNRIGKNQCGIDLHQHLINAMLHAGLKLHDVFWA